MANNDLYYVNRLRDNERVVVAINRAWGAPVAWVEDQWFDIPAKGKLRAFSGMLPVVRSHLVGGKMNGHAEPAFFAGPAPGTLFDK